VAEEERLRREYEHAILHVTDDDLDAAYAALRAEIQRPLREGIAVMFNMDGCDCDSSLEDVGWAAPHHASDCPVYERWEPVEERLRAS
jgi:hypothetical protein